jgi:hypothetical protein
MWTPLSRLPPLRDRMTTPTIDGDDMGKKGKKQDDAELPEGYERDVELETEIEKIIDDAATARIRIGANVNTYKRGDELTVPVDHPFWGGLIKQGLAEVIG